MASSSSATSYVGAACWPLGPLPLPPLPTQARGAPRGHLLERRMPEAKRGKVEV